MERGKIRKFSDLNAWKEGHQLLLFVYECTRMFPKSENFGLTSQIQRASVSVTSNIAEGFGRRTPKDKIYFYTLSKTSLAELQSQFFVAKDLQYISQEKFEDFSVRAEIVDRLIAGLVKSAHKVSSGPHT